MATRIKLYIKKKKKTPKIVVMINEDIKNTLERERESCFAWAL